MGLQEEMNGSSRGAELPPEVYALLNGTDLADKQEEAMMLITVSEDGWPHTAMLSVGEVAAASPNLLRIGLWQGTETSGNLKRAGKAALVLVYQGKVNYLKLQVKPLPASRESAYPRDRFEAELAGVKQDTAKYAEIVSGIRIALHDPPEVVKRWEATVRDLVREEED